ncbi:hypothetical protein EV200_10338 [Pedobacter psychrotolerans]|uniref:Phospholipase D-like protein n=1 Tax=Pedobacter psychrotolerans TaxID=1843235 RepID=A0A4V2RZK6_9SPHI|nr:hypothetical protein [Pedobacter psychrotolerans]TCO26708.1 hypothetical protein EV200_10338 [Pedobacter psychrotolerans]GGE55885.1 hypothetical protein GCM10011413_22820 [Pedobacter psychrotolerans]
MSTVKKFLGLVWMILGPLAMGFLLMQALDKVGLAHSDMERTNTILQWGIILFIFFPISIGLMVFGYYAWKGEYDQLADHSSD